MSTIDYRIASDPETALRLLRRYWRTPKVALETFRLWRRARNGLPIVTFLQGGVKTTLLALLPCAPRYRVLGRPTPDTTTN